MQKTMILINCAPTRMTRIKKYVPNQKTTHSESVALLIRKKLYSTNKCLYYKKNPYK